MAAYDDCMTPAQSTLGHEPAEPAPASALPRELAQAEEDYRRLRQAYLDLAKSQRNEVALAMVGADMDRAHAVLQELTGLPQLPFAHGPSRVLRRQASRLEQESA